MAHRASSLGHPVGSSGKGAIRRTWQVCRALYAPVTASAWGDCSPSRRFQVDFQEEEAGMVCGLCPLADPGQPGGPRVSIQGGGRERRGRRWSSP